MGRCGCGSDQQCLSTNPGNLASYDDTGCLYVAEFAPLFDAVGMAAPLDLVPLASGAWADTGMSLTIPAAGTFEVTADGFAILHVNVAADGGTGFVRAYMRLWNETLGALVPNTEVTMLSVGSNKMGRYQGGGGSSVHANVVTTGPTALKVQARRVDTSSGAAIATTINTSVFEVGGSSLRYNRIA